MGQKSAIEGMILGMSENLSERMEEEAIKNAEISNTIVLGWSDEVAQLEADVDKWKTEANRLYGVGQDIEADRVELKQQVKRLFAAWYECPQDSVPDVLQYVFIDFEGKTNV